MGKEDSEQSNQLVTALRKLDYSDMTADDWEAILEAHDIRLVFRTTDGTHTIEWDETKDELTFFVNGSIGYNYEGSRAGLESVAEQKEGLSIEPKHQGVQ